MLHYIESSDLCLALCTYNGPVICPTLHTWGMQCYRKEGEFAVAIFPEGRVDQYLISWGCPNPLKWDIHKVHA